MNEAEVWAGVLSHTRGAQCPRLVPRVSEVAYVVLPDSQWRKGCLCSE